MQVEDIAVITKMVADYNHMIDSGQAEAWADLFTDDGQFDPGLMPAIAGRAALVEFASGLPVMIPGARHHITNLSVDVDGDRATATAYLQLWMKGEDGSASLAMSGIYDDELVRTATGWRFSKRAMKAD